MTIELPSVQSPLSQPETDSSPNPKWKYWRLIALLLTLAATFLAQLPMSYDFASFVFYDPGASLRLDQLLAEGYTPTVDFGYPYGLLSLMIGRAFFAIAGRTPAGYLLFMFLAEAVIVWGLWRLAARWNGWAMFFLIAALPHAIIPVYLHLTHPLEAALIIHAIADVAAGRRARALALATACIFIKPVMTYGLGLIVIVWLIVRFARQREGHTDWRVLLSSFLPAVVTGIACSSATLVYFGFAPLKNTLLPLMGARSYQAINFGLFGSGQTFWWPELNGAAQYAKYYLFTPAGFWIVCTLLLAVFGLRSLFKLFRDSTEKHEAMVTIAACHFFFLAVFFGWPGSWAYYSYLLAAGVGLGLMIHRIPVALTLALALVALLGHTQTIKNAANAWQWTRRSPETAGLWSYSDQRDEWMRVRALAGDRQIFYLNNGCPELLFPNVGAPVSFFLSPATQTPKEIEHIQRQLEKAEVVVSFNQGPVLDAWNWPEFAAQRAAFIDTWRGTYLTIHERRRQ